MPVHNNPRGRVYLDEVMLKYLKGLHKVLVVLTQDIEESHKIKPYVFNTKRLNVLTLECGSTVFIDETTCIPAGWDSPGQVYNANEVPTYRTTNLTITPGQNVEVINIDVGAILKEYPEDDLTGIPDIWVPQSLFDSVKPSHYSNEFAELTVRHFIEAAGDFDSYLGLFGGATVVSKIEIERAYDNLHTINYNAFEIQRSRENVT